MEKFDPAMGPLKAYGMSLLNGVQREYQCALQTDPRTAAGRGDNRHAVDAEEETNEE